MVLGLLLARAGVKVTVLEQHGDFLRDFRGDTIHASTLTLLDELGLGPAFARMPHRRVQTAEVELDGGTVRVGDLRHLPGQHQHIAFAPQWDFLDLLAEAARDEPSFRLEMRTKVTGVLWAGSRVAGVTYRQDGTSHELPADLVVACDGRNSLVRRAAGLSPRTFGVPMDVWWFRVPRHDGDPQGAVGRFSASSAMVLIDRGDYFQCAYLIAKGTDEQVRAEGVRTFRDRVGLLVGWLADRLDAIGSLEDVKLLEVSLNRLRRWYGDGVLCIGDAAHAMSPVGGVGINLAVQDAVAAARYLAGPLRTGPVGRASLRRVQLRRWWPTALTQGAQRLAHARLIGRRVTGQAPPDPQARIPLPLRVINRVGVVQRVLGYAVAIGPRPEHAPPWAWRPPVA